MYDVMIFTSILWAMRFFICGWDEIFNIFNILKIYSCGIMLFDDRKKEEDIVEDGVGEKWEEKSFIL